MSISKKIDEAVKESRLAIQDIADKSFIDNKCLYEIRKGRYPSPDKTLRLAETLENFDLVRYQCQSCPIGRKFNMVNLDGNIRSEGHDIITKNQIEIDEFLEVAPEAFKILFSKQEFLNEEKTLIKKALHEALDIKHSVETLEVWYAKRFGIEELKKEIKEHNDKCYDEGYAIK